MFRAPSTGEDTPGMQNQRLIKMNENYFCLFKQLYNHILIKIIAKGFSFFANFANVLYTHALIKNRQRDWNDFSLS